MPEVTSKPATAHRAVAEAEVAVAQETLSAIIDGTIALGHTRLAVIDPEGGAQPIANEDGSIVAVVNGELYGHAAQARWLAGRGHRLRSRCDAEVLVHLYEELGDANGEVEALARAAREGVSLVDRAARATSSILTTAGITEEVEQPQELSRSAASMP